MIWGPPGIGKSSIVTQTAAKHGLDCVDLRLSQLAPTDLRGLPGGRQWCVALGSRPSFCRAKVPGCCSSMRINLAPPAMQGIAQQLILDRKVGSYVVPDAWYIWAAGNRKEDRRRRVRYARAGSQSLSARRCWPRFRKLQSLCARRRQSTNRSWPSCRPPGAAAQARSAAAGLALAAILG